MEVHLLSEKDDSFDVSASLSSSRGNHQTFALVIGINKYEYLEREHDLKGAVEDAENFKNYLLKDLGVAANNITNLRNKEATRDAIIGGFRRLKRNQNIVPGEVAIIIYFAGHRAVIQKPDAWTNWTTPTGEVEMLCPADINRNINGKDVPGIPDQTLSQLLRDLSNAKGDNIVRRRTENALLMLMICRYLSRR